MSYDRILSIEVFGLVQGQHGIVIWSEDMVVGKHEYNTLAVVIDDPLICGRVGETDKGR